MNDIFSSQDISNISRDNGAEKMAEIERICDWGLNRLARDIEAHDSSVVSDGEVMPSPCSNLISEPMNFSDTPQEGELETRSPEKEALPEVGFDDLFRGDD